MSFLRFFSAPRALRDLRGFLAQRQRHEIWFMGLALGLTLLVLWVFMKDSNVPAPPAESEIIYVESWPADRTDAQIRADQKKDMAVKEAQQRELERLRAERRAQFQRLDNQLESWGL